MPTNDSSRLPNRLLYAMQQQIVATFTETDWIELAYFTESLGLIRDDPCLLPALREGDDAGYRMQVFTVLETLLQRRSADELIEHLNLVDWLARHNPSLGADLLLTGDESMLGDLERAAAAEHIPELGRQINRIRRNAVTDPEIAVGQAKEMLETVMKYILGEHGSDSDIDIIKLAKMTRDHLGLDGGGANTYRNRTLSNLTQLVEGINKLRNLYGTGHGRSRAGETDPAHARLVVDSATALAVFFLAIHREQERSKDRSS